MTFTDLKEFLESQMRMSHIYQPVMIKHLLEKGGISTDLEIAKEIAQYDQSQVEYYQKITNNMVGKVLRNRRIVYKNQNVYHIEGVHSFSKQQIDELVAICDQKLDDYIKKRGERIWAHRNNTRAYISGSIKYEVLKRAGFRCELCGISAKERALEVDHILPRNLGGEDSINNYQALCYLCNSMKRDKDDTDFRNNSKKYDERSDNCPFCNVPERNILKENNLACLIFDHYPVARFHSLVIPKRHFSDYFDMTQPELNAINQLLFFGKEYLLKKDRSIQGFNIGVNSGIVAGQTIMHCHTHLIPRKENDVEDPRGGIRHVIPGMGYY